MTTEMYRQCRLEREFSSGRIETTSYLPARYARPGSFLALRDEAGTWTQGWKVLAVGPLVTDPPDWRSLIRGHRKMTGDSMPRGR